MVYSTARFLFSVLVVAGGVGLLGGESAEAQLNESRCASCHFANPYTEPGQDHLHDWDVSPHGREGVGCESCHGGRQLSTFESFLAHRDVLNSSNPASPVHRTQLSPDLWLVPRRSLHQFPAEPPFRAAERGGTPGGPTCTTCHHSVRANLLSPRSLEQRCESCHGDDGVAPRPGRAADARNLIEGISELRDSLSAARDLLENVRDDARRAELEEAYTQAEVPLIQARQAGHRFVFDALEERLSTARERVGESARPARQPGAVAAFFQDTASVLVGPRCRRS